MNENLSTHNFYDLFKCSLENLNKEIKSFRNIKKGKFRTFIKKEHKDFISYTAVNQVSILIFKEKKNKENFIENKYKMDFKYKVIENNENEVIIKIDKR